MKSIQLLGVRIDQISRFELENILKRSLNENHFSRIATVNPEFLVAAHRSENFRKNLESTDLNVCDGVGISIMGRLVLNTKIVRIPGVEVAEMVCKICAENGKSLFFLGGFGVAEQAAQEMKRKFPALKIAGTLDGNKDTFEEVRKASPDAILVAFGAPAQEEWLEKNGAKIPSLRLGVGVGGTFDFWAGKVRRAPKIVRSVGLEWLWRLIQEPRKRAKRIWNAVVVFPILAMKEKCTL